ncbi:MAG: (4Fe-4S)-binding protein [Candidatus Cloacimonadota bacterium]|nr:MAG: (4Fe-4S)-binding protein [Candidatus Cloacimonadota bacterium]PIE78239.1 MAG: (4Fe-4S)-binding protein [Candidatus Delongbacteria bacterium]
MIRNEIVVISGKGGTGKTTIVSSIIPFFKNLVIGDCDVDAPDLHIMLNPKQKSKEEFMGLKKASLDESKCIKCGKCYNHCKFGAITEDILFKHNRCEGCGVCEYLCPVCAIEMKEAKTGSIYHSQTDYGDMVHARLIPGEEASGKLVAKVRREAMNIAEKKGFKNIIIDGSPGVACNVISSITGASKVVIVVEPSLSGLHDLKRVYQLTQKFKLKTIVVINKFDISPKMSREIENYCEKLNITIGLKIPFSRDIVNSIVMKKIPSIECNRIFENIGFNNFIQLLKG